MSFFTNLLKWKVPRLDADGTGLVGPSSTIKFPQILLASGIPVGRPPSGTVGANGALTLDVALNFPYYGGIYLHFPANAVYSGSVAGFYWTVMSSTTAGTIYNEVLGSAFPTEIPSAPAAVASASVGAYVPSTSQLSVGTVVIPGGLMGPNGSFRISSCWSQTSSAANKTHSFYFGDESTSIEIESVTDRKQIATEVFYANRGSESRQVSITLVGYNGSWGAIGGTTAERTVNTTIDSTLWAKVQVNNGTPANEFLILEGITIQVNPS